MKLLKKLITYKKVKSDLPLTSDIKTKLQNFQKNLKNIFLQKEKKLIIFTGPCSIHDEKAAMEYAKNLTNLQKNLKNVLLIMRFHYEKPRSNNCWKGYFYDPKLDGSDDISNSIITIRKMLIKITELGLPISTEFLQPNILNYFDDLISWGFIGARTSASSIHRQLASSYEIPIGFKNSIDGNIEVAIDGAKVAGSKQSFIALNDDSELCQAVTDGNSYSHIVLRGSEKNINYDESSIIRALDLMKNKKFFSPIVIDASHGNSQKNFKNQIKCFEYIFENKILQKYPIIGLMLESNLLEGNQKLNSLNLRFGLSITDSCLGWEESEKLIYFADENFSKSFHHHHQ
ncbi:MAG: 3-deoxy-7-phosphoheptulonate synthase [Parachlamydiales bacterium]|nr:3-deoxy-7-phosphoheptulonate synthase [Parachlamydiales bacterium]